MVDVIPMHPTLVEGTLHAFVAFDWGDEIHLEQVRRLVTAATHELVRRPRTPTSFFYRPAPLQIPLSAVQMELGTLGKVQAAAVATLFDFAAVSIALRVPLRLTAADLLRFSGSLANTEPIVAQARALLQPLYERLAPAIEGAEWADDLSEEYFVFQLLPEAMPLAADQAWLAGLVHLEAGPLSSEEITEALRYRISYGPDDMLVTDWGAAVLVDRDCEETLQAIAFANLQLLEFRHADARLDRSLTMARQLIQPVSRVLSWRVHTRQLRALGELKVEANGLFERTVNALKLVGDPYLARVYRLVAKRFHLETWMDSIQRKLDVTEGVYQVLANQASTFRAEFLELTIILLILIEVVMGFVRH